QRAATRAEAFGPTQVRWCAGGAKVGYATRLILEVACVMLANAVSHAQATRRCSPGSSLSGDPPAAMAPP
ncbi:MAG TPA: hypothetical protein VJN94_11690, partial [Candidatus Binataceae bacterium]|nr:hypothetical protein [Candidatus Binataceae bacterium]